MAGTDIQRTRRTVAGASVGTLFEWYDFNLYVLLAAPIGANFFSGFPETTRAFFALLIFAVGFLVRPLGALVFGRISDKFGRKVCFLVTVVMMGLATVLVGVLPTYASVGAAAAIALVTLRVVQGLAVGGEYAGAAVFLAEHVPAKRRGFYTSFVQATITVSTLIALLLILLVRSTVSADEFTEWGWRIPFLLAIVPLVLSIWLRLRLEESPVFLDMQREGGLSKSPLREAVGNRANLRLMAIVLFGLVAGQTVLSYGGQVYPLVFMQSVLKVDFVTATVLQGWALAVAAVGFIVFGWLADRVGAKKVILAGFVLGAATYFPLFDALTTSANPALHEANRTNEIVIRAVPGSCAFQFNPTGAARFTSDCDLARTTLASRGAAFTLDESSPGGTSVTINGVAIEGSPELPAALAAALDAAGYPKAGDATIVKASGLFDIGSSQKLGILAILCILALYGSMVYAPLAALLVELFPPRIRTTAISLPYNIGNGWIGGLLPATSFALVAQTGDPLFGLWYPVGFTVLSLVVCWRFVSASTHQGGAVMEPAAG